LADGYIVRPFGKPEFLARIDAMLRLRSAQVELLQHRNHLEELVFARTAELAAARDAAEAANRAKSMFLANMSHELRTPMYGVMGMIDLALSCATDPQQIDWLNKSNDAAQHLLTILNDVLDISRIDAERLTLEENNFSLAHAIGAALDMHGAAARAKGLRLSSEIDPALPDLLRGDVLRLEKVLTNFIGNAVKFSQRGEIKVRAHSAEQDSHSVLLRIEVTDQGIGIRPEEQARLFNAFTQVDGSFTRKYDGAGLGLIIAKRLALLMGGEVGADGAPGVGSTFWFTARLQRAQGTACRQGEHSAVTPQLT
jgi:signal transduction histidine kinase